MATTVSLGWFLSLIHTIYHSVSMPLASSFSMTFMSLIMPIMLLTIINGMDEIKRIVLNKSRKMHLKGMKMLFPQMSNAYQCYPLSTQEQIIIAQRLTSSFDVDADHSQFFRIIEQITDDESLSMEKKNALKNGMVIKIKRGECFPVDCILLKGNTVVDSSLLTGEPQQNKQHLDFIPAGAINLGATVFVYATQDSYNSTINKLLFRSNRANDEKQAVKEKNTFAYIYTTLIIVGIVASIITPFILGILTVPLLLQNVTGILFAVCPCTMSIAQQLPNLLNIYQRGNNGIIIRDENLCKKTNKIHTIVFDKTGTLTTGNSQVESSTGISSSLWERVYLLEKHHGAEHPLAKAINRYYETTLMTQPSLIKDIKKVTPDTKNRGLSGMVQGKQIHIGNAEYLRELSIMVPELHSREIEQGYTPIYIAEENAYQGVIYIKHEIRKDVLTALTRFKAEGKKLIMLTGDSASSAIGFNQQHGAIFDEEHIHSQQTPQHKESFLSQLFSKEKANPEGVWFVGDGLNDAPSAKIVSENGGVSCAMTNDDKTSFFTDLSLNGSLNYLFEHNKLNQFLQKNILQNQLLLMYGAIAFIAFIISFSIAGIAVAPLIPLLIMASTTLMVLFNSYRVQLTVDNALEPNSSWVKQLLASDLSIGLLTGASMLLKCGLLIATIATGGFTFPTIIFTAGVVAAISSLCILTALTLFAAFALIAVTYLCINKNTHSPQEESLDERSTPTRNNDPNPSLKPDDSQNTSIPYPFWNSIISEESGAEELCQEDDAQTLMTSARR